jgi:hypothetical protein
MVDWQTSTNPVNNQIIICIICIIERICIIYMYNMQNMQNVQTWTPVALVLLQYRNKGTRVLFIPSSVLVSIVNSRSNLQNQILSVPCSVPKIINMQNILNMHNVKEYAEHTKRITCCTYSTYFVYCTYSAYLNHSSA